MASAATAATTAHRKSCEGIMARRLHLADERPWRGDIEQNGLLGRPAITPPIGHVYSTAFEGLDKRPRAQGRRRLDVSHALFGDDAAARSHCCGVRSFNRQLTHKDYPNLGLCEGKRNPASSECVVRGSRPLCLFGER